MTSKNRSLPTWEECDALVKGRAACALEKFIQEQEPQNGPIGSGHEHVETKFRDGLSAVIAEVRADVESEYCTRPCVAEIDRLTAENKALRNLADKLQPGPISQALQGTRDETVERLTAERDKYRTAILRFTDAHLDMEGECTFCGIPNGRVK